MGRAAELVLAVVEFDEGIEAVDDAERWAAGVGVEVEEGVARASCACRILIDGGNEGVVRAVGDDGDIELVGAGEDAHYVCAESRGKGETGADSGDDGEAGIIFG